METINFAENVESVGGAAAGVTFKARESKNAAVNTEPVGCAFCGSRNYIQIIHPQANCHRGFCTGSTRRCKASAGVFDDRFSVHEPVFSSPPLFQPLFQNRLVPPNVFYSNLSHSSENDFHGMESGLHSGLQTNKVSKQPPQCFMFYSEGDNRGTSTRNGEEGLKDEEASRNSGNGTEAIVSSLGSQVCSCSNMIPWTCSPYIVPMVSYIVSWNPVYPNKRPNEIHFTGEEKTDKTREDSKQGTVSMSKNRGKREEKPDDSCTREKSDKFDWKTMYELKGSSTSFVSIGSLECGDDGFPLCDKKGEAGTKNLGYRELDRKFSHQETQELANGSETNSVARSEENQLGRSDSVHDSLIDSAKVSSASSTTSQSEAESSPSNADVTNHKDVDDAEESPCSIQKLEEELQEPKTKDRPVKKPIKNFTMAEEGKPDTEDDSNECVSNRIAAAGDVVDNLSESKGASRNQSVTSELDCKESKEDIVRDPEAGESLPVPKKELSKKKRIEIKSQSPGRVGIGKLSAIAKPKNPILTPDSSSALVKRKHNCVAPKTTTTTNISDPALPKNQRTKLRTAVQSKGFENLKLKMAAAVNMREEEAKRRADTVKGLRQSVALEKEAVKTCLKTRK